MGSLLKGCMIYKWYLWGLTIRVTFILKRGYEILNADIDKGGDSPVIGLDRWNFWNDENKSCVHELKFCEVSENSKSSICWKFHLSISKTGESTLLCIFVFPIIHPLLLVTFLILLIFRTLYFLNYAQFSVEKC